MTTPAWTRDLATVVGWFVCAYVVIGAVALVAVAVVGGWRP